jgi:hypothetical protein
LYILYIVDVRRKRQKSIKRRNVTKRQKDRRILEGFDVIELLALIVHRRKTSVEDTARWKVVDRYKKCSTQEKVKK